MNTSINKVTLRGKIGSNRIIAVPDSRAARFTVATSEIYKNKQGLVTEETQWHNIVVWEGEPIENIELIQAGKTAHVEGKLRNVRYTGSDGLERVLTEILASKITIEE